MYRVTIVKDKVTRKSKGVAFVLFLERDSAYKAVRALNNTQVSLCKNQTFVDMEYFNTCT